MGQAAGVDHDFYGGVLNKVTYCTCYYDEGMVLDIEDYSNNNQTTHIFYSDYYSKDDENYNILNQ